MPVQSGPKWPETVDPKWPKVVQGGPNRPVPAAAGGHWTSARRRAGSPEPLRPGFPCRAMVCTLHPQSLPPPARPVHPTMVRAWSAVPDVRFRVKRRAPCPGQTTISTVMPARVAGIHLSAGSTECVDTWMAGTSPAMTSWGCRAHGQNFENGSLASPRPCPSGAPARRPAGREASRGSPRGTRGTGSP